MGVWTLMLLGWACSARLPADPGPLADPSLPGIEEPSGALDTRLAASLAGMEKSYVPRTHHLDAGKPVYTNRLIDETSPYLLQHAHNPVNWFPWGEAAFERARELDRPVLLSVGYSTCHWCHVMEKESFEDTEIAAFINQHFVAIKVDREERPDVDDVYMLAVYAFKGRGGWPMTVVMTPDAKPFFAATYIPARDGDRGRSKGFLSVLRELASVYRHDKSRVLERAEEVSKRVRMDPGGSGGQDLPPREVLLQGARGLARTFDAAWGGFGKAPKFPQPSKVRFLMRYHQRTGDPVAWQMVRKTLERMDAGGLHDHVGGGFHRYSVDARWHVPHYEKMLYDNAQLASAYTEAWRIEARPEFKRVVRSTLNYLLEEMTDPVGAFHAATDADSPGPNGEREEGLFHTWTRAELVSALGKTEGSWFAGLYGVPAQFAERPTLMRRGPHPADVGDGARHEAARRVLDGVRAKRAPPLKDDKIVAAWNGLAISAFADAGRTFKEPRWIAAAERAASFVLDKMRDEDGRLHRTWRTGRARHPATAEDLAFLTAGLLDLFEATANPRWLREARSLHDQLQTHYADSRGGWYLTPADGEVLLTRTKSDHDSAEPAPSSVAIDNAMRLLHWTSEDIYRQQAVRALGAFAPRLQRSPASLPAMLSGLMQAHGPGKEVVIVRPDGVEDALTESLRTRFLPLARVVSVDASAIQAVSDVAVVTADKVALDGEPTAYVCELGVCQRPVTTVEALEALLTREPLFLDRDVPPLALQ